jgi:hypothetical protein
MFRGTLIRSGNNAKTIKGDDVYETAIMYLAPARMAVVGNTCPMAETAGCIAGCLNTAGRGKFSNVQQARVNKTKRYFADRVAFMAELVTDLEAFVRYCKRNGRKPAVRLNGTSDIQWEIGHDAYRVCPDSSPVAGKPRVVGFASIFAAFPEVEFYDYTKIAKRVARDLPANYTLVLSYSEANGTYADTIAKAAANASANVAVVFRSKEVRDTYMAKGFLGRQVIDGDETDMRFLDPARVVVGLYAKGAAKVDHSGFVVD